MRKTQVALAALALVASTAALADVKVYGGVDAAVVSNSAGTAFAGGGNSGVSLIGFSGSEDLGGGLKAGFALETGYTTATGSLTNGGYIGSSTSTPATSNVNALFNRQANVSLSTENAGVTLGTQISPFILAGLTGTTAVGGAGVYVPALARLDGGSLAVTTVGGLGTGGFFIADAVGINVNGGGISANVLYRVREKSSTSGEAQSAYAAANLTTSAAGINFALGYQQVSSAASDERKNIVVAANTSVAGIRLNGAYSNNSGSGTTTGTDSNGYIVGASMPVTGALSAGLTYARNSALASKTQTSLSLQYDLSKATYAYLNYSTFSAATSGATASNDGGGLGDAKSLMAVGVAHSF